MGPYMAKRLHSLKAAEVSLVPRGANGKRFAVTKEDSSVDAVRATPQGLLDRVRKTLATFAKKPKDGDTAAGEQDEGLSREAQTALEATARILAPHKDEITDGHLDAIQEHLGIGGGDHDEETEDGDDESESDEGDDMADKKKEMKPEHMESAKGAAKKAYKEHLEKLGYAEYPDGELTMKAKADVEKKKDDADEEDEDDKGDDKVAKETKVLKEDGSLNLEAVPENMRPFMEVVAKEMVASKSRADAAEQRSVKLEKELADSRLAARKSEIVGIAKGMKHLDQSHSVMVLELADAAGKDKFDTVLKGLEAQEAQLSQGGIFETIGSSLSSASGNASDAMAKVEKAVEGIVQKSAESGVRITKEQAMADYLMAHPELYAQEKARREASSPNGA